jgi:UDP-hydrolysing UDP-N-acetyl-D-glucosamine 2-epimerase
MGEEPNSIHVTGCPSIDLAREVLDGKGKYDVDPFELYGGLGEKVDLSHGFLILMQHPVTTEHSLARAQIEETLYGVKDIGIPVLVFWPNPDAGSDGTSKGIRVFREKHRAEKFHFFKNMEPHHFLSLLRRSKCLVGNSSVAIRECSFLGVPAVNIGARQTGRDRGGNVIDVDHDRNAISEAVQRQLRVGKKKGQDLIYGDGYAGEKIADRLATCNFTIEKRLTY